VSEVLKESELKREGRCIMILLILESEEKEEAGEGEKEDYDDDDDFDEDNFAEILPDEELAWVRL